MHTQYRNPAGQPCAGNSHERAQASHQGLVIPDHPEIGVAGMRPCAPAHATAMARRRLDVAQVSILNLGRD